MTEIERKQRIEALIAAHPVLGATLGLDADGRWEFLYRDLDNGWGGVLECDTLEEPLRWAEDVAADPMLTTVEGRGQAVAWLLGAVTAFFAEAGAAVSQIRSPVGGGVALVVTSVPDP
jgi:hypothetical protein